MLDWTLFLETPRKFGMFGRYTCREHTFSTCQVHQCGEDDHFNARIEDVNPGQCLSVYGQSPDHQCRFTYFAAFFSHAMLTPNAKSTRLCYN